MILKEIQYVQIKGFETTLAGAETRLGLLKTVLSANGFSKGLNLDDMKILHSVFAKIEGSMGSPVEGRLIELSDDECERVKLLMSQIAFSGYSPYIIDLVQALES